jgi:hypothetical protein
MIYSWFCPSMVKLDLFSREYIACKVYNIYYLILHKLVFVPVMVHSCLHVLKNSTACFWHEEGK